jgi:spermidine/putrescine transport system substrate-binding protein
VPLPTDKRPNFDANASVAVTDPSYDPGNKFTMAWQSGLTGIGWDPVQVKALRPSNPTITSVMDLFDPAFKGKVGMFADNADMPNLVMIGMGIDPTTSTLMTASRCRPAHEAEGRRDRPAVLHPELHERAAER